MKRMAVILACVLGSWLCGSAGGLEEFVMGDGTVLSGAVVRTAGPQVTLKTTKGVATYHVMEFSPDTRVKHFDQVEASFLRQKAEAERKAEEARAANAGPRDSGKRQEAKSEVERMWDTNTTILWAMRIVGGLAVLGVLGWIFKK